MNKSEEDIDGIKIRLEKLLNLIASLDESYSSYSWGFQFFKTFFGVFFSALSNEIKINQVLLFGVHFILII